MTRVRVSVGNAAELERVLAAASKARDELLKALKAALAREEARVREVRDA